MVTPSRLLLLFLTAAPLVCGQLNFVVLGNWGPDPFGTDVHDVPDQHAVADAIDAYAAGNAVNSIWSTGDQFYPNGLETQDDPRFEATWKNVYTTKPNIGSLIWFPCVGNRDHNSSDRRALYQVNKSTGEPTWSFPQLYYDELFTDGVVDVHLVILDTDLIIENHFQGDPLYDRTVQLNWFNSVLTQPADYTVVAGHHPLRSCGRYGPTDDILTSYIEPAMIANNVDLYVCGHDQNMQVITNTATPSEFGHIVNGAGGKDNYPLEPAKCDPLPGLGYTSQHFSSVYGFTTLGFDSSSATVTHYDTNGTALYTYIRPITV